MLGSYKIWEKMWGKENRDKNYKETKNEENKI